MVALALEQRHRRAERSEQPGQIVGQRNRHTDGRPVREPRDVGEAADGRGRGTKVSLVAIGAVLAIAGDAYEDDIRVGRLHRLVAQVPAFKRAGSEILMDRATSLDKLEEQLAATRGMQVERD